MQRLSGLPMPPVCRLTHSTLSSVVWSSGPPLTSRFRPGSIDFIDAAFVPYLAAQGVSLGNSDPLGMGFQGRAPRDLVNTLVDDWGFEALVVWRATKARDVIDSANKLLAVIEEGRRIIQAR